MQKMKSVLTFEDLSTLAAAEDDIDNPTPREISAIVQCFNDAWANIRDKYKETDITGEDATILPQIKNIIKTTIKNSILNNTWKQLFIEDIDECTSVMHVIGKLTYYLRNYN